MSIAKEFREFAVKGNVVDMAVGIIIGAAFGKIVSSLVSDVVTPPLGYVIGGVDFTKLLKRIWAGRRVNRLRSCDWSMQSDCWPRATIKWRLSPRPVGIRAPPASLLPSRSALGAPQWLSAIPSSTEFRVPIVDAMVCLASRLSAR